MMINLSIDQRYRDHPLGGLLKLEQLAPGEFLTNSLNAGTFLVERVNAYPELPDSAPAYGVCDSPEQWRAAHRATLESDPRLFAVIFVEVLREERHGWRWHKWGPYIGIKRPQCEYLHDEPEIDKVMLFHVYEIKEKKS